MREYNVKLKMVKEKSGSELSDIFYQNCSFCSKIVQLDGNNCKSCNKMGGSKFHCPFCLRNKFHYKSNKHILILSFRSIIGYYYHRHYMHKDEDKRLWLSQIKNMIELHAGIGLNHPAFYYDPETFLWFVDFNQIGSGPQKALFDEVKNVVLLMLDCFQLSKMSTIFAYNGTKDKYETALDSFYSQRKRPKDKKMLIPTLCEVGGEKKEFFERTRNFTKISLIAK